MIATNHALTGALIGLTVHNPWVAVPAAVLSHYALDMLPHFSTEDAFRGINTTGFKGYLLADASACISLVALLFATQPAYWLMACICAFLAAAPDMVAIRQFIIVNKGSTFVPNLYEAFSTRIQWFERISGWPVELVWLGLASFLLWQFL
jgi:hypothetical protein